MPNTLPSNMASIQQRLNETIFNGLVEFDKYCEKLLPYGTEIGAGLFVVAVFVWFVVLKNDLPWAEKKPILDAAEFKNFPLIGKKILSHNTAKYRFGLPKKDDSLGLPIGQHISLAAEIDGKQVMRSYTPTTLDHHKGYFELVVKTYEKGNISRHLSLLKIGDTMKVRGPKGKFNYHRKLAPHLLMLAGGSGITPMYQIIQSSILDPLDKTEIDLIYANVNEDDILLRKELDTLAEKSNGRLRVFYVLNNAPEGWTGGIGFVSKEMIDERKHAEGISAGGKVLLCGPPPMLNAMKGHLTTIGYPAARTVSKLEDQVFLF
ncbi:NADH-cytochrome b5 reductase [Vanrija albida]|uniref:NADH-cytochrome b5 reductase n=1 Tax=Vanrija albida TaxID=181172 RepID=A0ABR3QCM0_9TREE